MLAVLGTGTECGCGCRLGLGQDWGLWTDESGGDDGVDGRTLGKGVVCGRREGEVKGVEVKVVYLAALSLPGRRAVGCRLCGHGEGRAKVGRYLETEFENDGGG